MADVFTCWNTDGHGEVEDEEVNSVEVVRGRTTSIWACCICMADDFTRWKHNGHLRMLLHNEVLDVVLILSFTAWRVHGRSLPSGRGEKKEDEKSYTRHDVR